MPAGQPPGIGSGFAAECAAKVESCCVKCRAPQLGHASPSAASERRTSFSKRVPQSSQRYSNIGIS